MSENNTSKPNNLDSQLRLFLSIDIAGSTRLKNTFNHHHTLREYHQRIKVMTQLCSSMACGDDCEKHSPENLKSAVLDGMSSEDTDWAPKIEEMFKVFHATFLKKINDVFEEEAPTLLPWKALGDELIYSQKLNSLDDVHKYMVAFMMALRENDKASLGKQIRLKGSAWTAGFPIRNRIVTLPFLNGSTHSDELNFPRHDFLGPDMDIGFRIGKCVWPGFIVITIELAYLLSKTVVHQQVRLCQVGWETLKGVWNNISYPIFWAYLPDESELKCYDYSEYKRYDVPNSIHLQNWCHQTISKLEEAKNFADQISSLFAELPSQFGVELPYIKGDRIVGNIPDSHAKILELLSELDRLKTGVDGNQNEYPPSNDVETTYNRNINILNVSNSTALATLPNDDFTKMIGEALQPTLFGFAAIITFINRLFSVDDDDK